MMETYVLILKKPGFPEKLLVGEFSQGVKWINGPRTISAGAAIWRALVASQSSWIRRSIELSPKSRNAFYCIIWGGLVGHMLFFFGGDGSSHDTWDWHFCLRFPGGNPSYPAISAVWCMDFTNFLETSHDYRAFPRFFLTLNYTSIDPKQLRQYQWENRRSLFPTLIGKRVAAA